MPTLPGETSVIPSARDLAVARAVQTAEERQGFYRLEDVIAAIPEPEPSVENLSTLLSQLRRPQMSLASERPRPEAVV